MNMFKKVALGFLFVGLAFGVMVVCELVRGVGVDASVKASVFWPFLFVTVITIGEMCFSLIFLANKKLNSLVEGKEEA